MRQAIGVHHSPGERCPTCHQNIRPVHHDLVLSDCVRASRKSLNLDNFEQQRYRALTTSCLGRHCNSLSEILHQIIVVSICQLLNIVKGLR